MDGVLTGLRNRRARMHVLLDQLFWPPRLAGGSVHVSASVGVALQLPHDPQESARLLACADQAMYETRRPGKGRVAWTTAELEREML
jgi:predicted signal transduction protein with EAL and GGDEF domain